MSEVAAIVTLWRADLSARIARAQLKQELIGLDEWELMALEAEVAEFTRAVKVLQGIERAA